VSSQPAAVTGPYCTRLGCRSHADRVVEHPEHGERPVCTNCADEDGLPVVRWIA